MQTIRSAAQAVSTVALGPWSPFGYRKQVNDVLWRGSQPKTRQDWEALIRDTGIKCVINLRDEYPEEKEIVEGLGLRYVYIPIVDFTIPKSDAQTLQFLDAMGKAENLPAFIHCRAGVGRTGLMVACYRMAYEGWEPKRAVWEAMRHRMIDGDQTKYVLAFGKKLEEGKIPGYPKKPMGEGLEVIA